VQQEQAQLLQQMKTTVAKMRFLREDETAVVQVGPDFLGVNHLQPYPGWETFKTLIIEQLEIYKQVATPQSLLRLELRYINRVEIIPTEEIKLGNYFCTLPQVPNSVPLAFSSFLLHVEIPYEEPRSLLRLAFGSVPPKEQDRFPFMFDVTMLASDNEIPSLEREVVSQWLDIAHQRIEAAFDASFTEKTHKEIFEERV
jgi:uncharacterized protein (TIGR04255 family)